MTGKIEISDRAFMGAQIRSNSLNEAARTVDVIFSTGAAVKRYSWDEGYYMEELDMAPSSVDLDRLNAGASFLDTHDQSGMASRLGAVQPGSARIEGGKGVATITLSTSPAGEQILSDLRAGLPLPVSVGYRIHQYSKTEGDGDALPVYRATQWEPLEISAVSVPADFGAQARNEPETSRATVTVITARRAEGSAALENNQMTTTTTDPVALERARVAEINLIGANHRASPGLIKRSLAGDVSAAQFRELILDEMRANFDRHPINSIAPLGYEGGERNLGDRLADVVMARVRPGHKLEADARQYAGFSTAELARVALHARGESTTGMRPSELITRALHTTTDFGLALSNVANRQVREGYEAAPSQIKRIARETTAKDFRSKTTLQLAEAGTLEKVNEHGEFRRGTWNETGESYKIDTFGKIFGLTRQMLVNDDLQVLAEVPSRLGEYSSRFESAFLAKLLEAPPKTFDGLTFWHASHGNLAAAGSSLSVTSLGTARLALRRQRGVGGEIIAVEPKFLLVPPELETLAEQTLAQINAAKTEDVNPFAGRLELVVEPHLTDVNAWYLAASPGQIGMEFAYLEGSEGPQVETRIGFDIDGTEWKVRLDFGGGFADTRGLYKNPGVPA